MLQLLKQEIYKLVHKTGTWIALGVMFGVQILIAILAKGVPDFLSASAAVSGNFMGSAVALFIMIASAASIIAMEFQYGTIRQLLYRKYYRSQVFMSKIIVIIGQAICLWVIQFAFTLLLKVIMFPKVDLGQSIGHGQTLLSGMVRGSASELLSAMMLLSIVVLLSTLFKSNAAAITTGYIGYFVIQIASSMLLLVIDRWEWVKWNPLTMLLFGQQVAMPDLSQATHLSTGVMAGGSVVYTVIFAAIAYAFFRKRSV
jgi:ABC-2 type transport system permease protein